MRWKHAEPVFFILFCTLFIFQRIHADEQFSFESNWGQQESSNLSDIGTDVVVYGNYVYSLSICGTSMCINKYGMDGQRIFNRTYSYINNTILGSNMIFINDSIYVLSTAGNDTWTKIPHNYTIGLLGQTDLYLAEYNETTGNFVRGMDHGKTIVIVLGVLFGTPAFDITGEVAWSAIDQTFVVVSTVFASFDGNTYQVCFIEVPLNEKGQLDVIIAKFAMNLTMVWSRQYGSPAVDRGISLTVDNDVLSAYYGYIVAVAETYDVLVIQIDKNGNSETLYQTGTAGLDSPGGVTYDSDYIYVLAILQSTTVSVLRYTKDLVANSTLSITSSSQSFAASAITKDVDGGLLVLGYDLGSSCWFVGKAAMEDGDLTSLGSQCTQLQSCYLSYFTSSGGIAVGNTSGDFFVSACSNTGAYNAYSTNTLDAYTISFHEVPAKDSHHGSGSNPKVVAVVLAVIFTVLGTGAIIGLSITVYRLKMQQKKLSRSTSEPVSESSTVNSAANSVHMSVTISKHPSEPNWIIDYNDIQMKKKIGVGGFGEVYRAKWKGSDVAVKLLVSVDPSQQGIQDFFSEADVMKKLRPHPNVVQLIGFFETPLGIVTEYVPRGSLEAWLHSDKPISEEQKITILHGTAVGMLYLHSEGILHRDLATRNILLDKTLCPKLCDFGLSRVMIDERTHKSVNGIGPIRWMAPEALTESKYNKKSDVWSYGVVTYEVMTRQEPYHGTNLFEVSIKVPTGALSLVSEMASRSHEFPPLLMSILSICLQIDPAWRPEFSQLAEWLESYTIQSPSMSLVYQESNDTENPHEKYKASRVSRNVDGSFLPPDNSNV